MDDYRPLAPQGEGDPHPPAVREAAPPSLAGLLLSEKLTIAAVLPVLLGLGVVFCASLVAQYRAESLVMVEPREAHLVEQSTVLEHLRVDAELLQTEAQLIESQATLEAVAGALGLGHDAEFAGDAQDRPSVLAMLRQWIADALFRLSGDRPAPEALPALPHQNVPVASVAATSLERHVSASPIGKTYLIAIDVTSSDPVKAAIIANSVADHYIADRISSRIETSEAASAAIHSRLTELGERLRRGEMALAQFKAKTGLLQTLSASGSPAPILQHELSDTSTQLNDARSLEAKLAAKLAQLTSAKGGGASGEALASPLIQQLREQEATLAAQYAQITTRLGPNHPTTKETEHALAAVRGQIGNATSDIRRSVAADLAGVHGQEQLLQARLAALRTRISGEAGEEAQLASLQSDVDSSRSVYEAFLARFKATTEQRHLEQPIATVVSTARVPQRPYSPRLGTLVPGIIGMSVFGAAGAGLLRGWLRRGYWSPSRVAAELGVREVVTLPAVPRPSRRRRAIAGTSEPPCQPGSAVRRSVEQPHLPAVFRRPRHRCPGDVLGAERRKDPSRRCAGRADGIARQAYAVGGLRSLQGFDRSRRSDGTWFE